MTDAVATGIAVTLLLLCALHWRLAGLPARLTSLARLARDELDRARAADDAQAQKELAEAVNARAGVLLAGVRQYQEQVAADFRKQIADAERKAEDAQIKARLADRNAVDTATALETATSLVRELRTTLDGLGELPALVREARRRRRGTVAPPEDPGPAEPDDNRKTIEIQPPPTATPSPSTAAPSSGAVPSAPASGAAASEGDDDEWNGPEEQTRVFGAGKPGAASKSAAA